jgi:type VI secretion system protein ImpK
MFLLERFHEFYREVLSLKERVKEDAYALEEVRRRLTFLLERQALEAGRGGGDFGLEVYRRAQYAMAALADEIFLHLPWSGQEAWRNRLLEAHFFGSHRAGEELFERMDRLVQDSDAAYRELGRVYLAVLALGFQGRYRNDPEAPRKIEEHRSRLFRFIFGRDPEAIRGQARLMPEAYAATLDEGRTSTLPHLKPWIWAMVAVVLLWIAGGHLLWRSVLTDIRPLVDEILSQEDAPPGTVAAVEAGREGGRP